MKDYMKEMTKFQIDLQNLPKYECPEEFAQSFKRCTIYKDVNTTYSNITNTYAQKQIIEHA